MLTAVLAFTVPNDFMSNVVDNRREAQSHILPNFMHRATISPSISTRVSIRWNSRAPENKPLQIPFQIARFKGIPFRCTDYIASPAGVSLHPSLQVSNNARIIASECHSLVNTRRSLKCHNVIDRVRRCRTWTGQRAGQSLF